jgi:hypothetical protein
MNPKHAQTSSILSLAVGLSICLALPLCAQVAIEVVNDSGRPDTNVFIKVPGQFWNGNPGTPVTPADLFVNITNASGYNPTSLPLSSLATNGTAATFRLVSTASGRTNTVYTFQADYLNAGAIYFTYNHPFTFTNGLEPSAPPDSAGNACRYDYAELSINDNTAPNNAVDVTYVDKFGIPLQVEWFKGTHLVSGSFVYASTRTLAERFDALGLGAAVFTLTSNNITPGWQYTNASSYSNFARILAPQKTSGSGTSVAPYPSVANYLNSLVGSNGFWLNGASAQAGYYFLGYQVTLATNASGWLVTMACRSNMPPHDTNQITGSQYTNTITFPIPSTNPSGYIYGSPVGPNLYSVNGVLVTSKDRPTYAVETWMIGDVLSAINFGFWGGVYGTNSMDWYSKVKWTSVPFGSARSPNNGYYNPYTALIYNAADPYGYAFSERITPDVIMVPLNGDRIRITILPDDRLDSPLVSTPSGSAISSNSITLNWGAVRGAGGYRVSVLRPPGVPPVDLPSSATSHTLTNLAPGTPHVMTVQATGFTNGTALITPARPVAASTLGTRTCANGNLTLVQSTFSVADPFYQVARVYIQGIELLRTADGQWLTHGVPARWIASAGTNEVVVTVVGTNNEVLFNDWLTFVLAEPFMVTNTTHSAISNVVFHGQKLSQPAPDVTGFLNGTSSNSFLVSTLNVSLSIGLSYVPAETRRYAPVVIPSQGGGIRLGNALMLTNGAFQFQYANSGTQLFKVYASPNLTNWSDIGTAAVISPGLYRFTDYAATNYPRRFYQLRLP